MKTKNTNEAAAYDYISRRLLNFKRILIEPFSEAITAKFPNVNPEEIFSQLQNCKAVRIDEEFVTVQNEDALLKFMQCKEVHLILNHSTSRPRKTKNTFLWLEKLSA